MNSIHVNLFLVLRTWKLQHKQNKGGKEPLFHFMSGFLLSGEAAEKPQDIAPKHLKGKVVSFPKSIKRKRRWWSPASKDADWGWLDVHQRLRSTLRCGEKQRAVHTELLPRQRRRVWQQTSDHRLECLRWTFEFFYDLGCPTCSCEGKTTASSHKGVQDGERPTLLIQV